MAKEDNKKEKKGLIAEFREFIARGNVMDMAVGIIIGTAFGAIISSLVNDIIMPVIGALIGNLTVDQLCYKFSEDNVLAWGNFVQTVIDFVLIALVIFFIIKGFNVMRRKFEKKQAEEEAEAAPPAGPTQEELLAEIRDLLKQQNNK